MGERLNSEEFSNYLASQSNEELQVHAVNYRQLTKSGVSRFGIGVIFIGGTISSTLASNIGDPLRYVALGELAIGALSGMSGIVNLVDGVVAGRATKREIQSRGDEDYKFHKL